MDKRPVDDAPVQKHPVEEIAEACGGTITEAGILPDGSGFAVMSMPLRKDHWIYKKFLNVPPMPFRMGSESRASLLIQTKEAVEAGEFLGMTRIFMTKEDFEARIRDAGRYAVRSATMNGKEMDFDPDALIQNLVVGMLGYWTENGLTSDDWANPEGGGGKNWKAPERPAVAVEMQATGPEPGSGDGLSRCADTGMEGR